MIPRFDLTDLANARALELLLGKQDRTITPGVTSTDHTVAGRGGNSISVRVYRPDDRSGPRGALFYIHGGGFMLGGLHTEDERCELYAAQVGCVVIGVDYRLAPEHPFPAAFEDCADALEWVGANASDLGIDARRIAVGGNSAGGAVAASLALRSRTTGPLVSHQFLINPVLDCRSTTPSALAFVDTPVWTRADNLLMWSSYLDEASAPVDYTASPSLASDLVDAPPASIWIADQDPLRDEALEYVRRLLGDGVQVSFHQYLGTFHGFDSYRMTKLGQRALADQVWALQRAFLR